MEWGCKEVLRNNSSDIHSPDFNRDATTRRQGQRLVAGTISPGFLASLLILFRVFVQSRRRVKRGLGFRTGHRLVHRIRGQVNAARPTEAALNRFRTNGADPGTFPV
jgi:hypothetical protein